MLLQNNATENMTELSLLYSLFFWMGLIITYIFIIYSLEHPKKKKMMLTYGANLRRYTQEHLIHYDSNSDNEVLLVNNKSKTN